MNYLSVGGDYGDGISLNVFERKERGGRRPRKTLNQVEGEPRMKNL